MSARPRAWAWAAMLAACAPPTAAPLLEDLPPIPPIDGAEHVDPFIGTAGEGYTFPGAVAPWGMVAVSPHNLVASPLDYLAGNPIAPAGYLHGRPELYGFGATHLSGVGCPELGVPRISVSTGPIEVPTTEVGLGYEDEVASPGYYAVHLPSPGVTVEATATTRAGILRLTFEGGEANVMVDAGPGLSWFGADGHVRVRSPTELEGYATTGSFCARPNEQRVYFAIRASTPADDTGTWVDATPSDASEADGDVGAWLSFQAIGDAPIELRIAVSFVSEGNAWKNLDAEVGGSSFDDVHEATRATWSELLSRIQVAGGTDAEQTMLYTALYHALLHPSIFSDVDGRVPSMGGGVVTAPSPRYTVYSLWDSYRTVHPLLALVYPEQQQRMLQSLAQMTAELGAPPQWELAASEVNMMVGDPASSVIADAVLGGFDDFDVEGTYQLMRAAALDTESSRRPGNAEYWAQGYVPMERQDDAWGPVSTTLEYAYADWALAQLAAHLGHDDDAARFGEQSETWRNLFDVETGLLRPRNADGGWYEPFDPDALEGSNPLYQSSGGPGYVEGTAWHYAFAVPHDPEGLMAEHGGPGPFGERLQALFDEDRFAMWNEPDIAFPWLFTYVPGEERRSIDAVADAMGHFGAGPDGLPGNDDAGAMSAWYVFAALGLYPDCPGRDRYALARPRFERVTVALDPAFHAGERLEIVAGDGDGWSFDGVELPGAWIPRSQVVAGGRLETP